MPEPTYDDRALSHAFDFLNQRPPTEPRRGMTPLKIIGWIISVPLAAFVIFAISSHLDDHEYYAHSVNLTISECEQFTRAFGHASYGYELCRSRVPKVRR